MPEKPKTLVIGLDGGNLALLERLANEGHMPFFQSLIQRGVRGDLHSIFPPSTPPAWTTFMTGKNPGKHSIMDFFSYSDCATPPHVVNSTFIQSETLWSVLSKSGKRICVLNVPMTYPPQPVNGLMMTGLLTPSTDLNFTYPSSLYNELRGQLGEFIIEVPWRDYPPKRFPELLNALAHCSFQRSKYVRMLMEQEPWDFFMAVFSETDAIQHSLWSFLDPSDTRYSDEATENGVREYFRLLDTVLEDICTLAGKETQIFFMSDHGFGPLLKWVHINTWLCKLGLLDLDKKRIFALRAMKRLSKLVRKIDRHGWREKLLARAKSVGNHPSSILSCINWQRTKAFYALLGEQGIRINLKGREPHGIISPGREYELLRDQIIGELERLRDPETGECIGSFVKRREEVFTGPYLERAPDVVFLLGGGKWVADAFPGPRVFEPTDWKRGTGTHRMEGLFLASGPGIKAGREVSGARIEDLFPTILYSLGLPIPRDIDGKVLSTIYDEAFLSNHDPVYVESSGEISAVADTLDADEEKDVIEKLRSLGYLD